jgi:predicted membrane protein
MDTPLEPQPRVRITSQLILGAAIATVGVLFTLDNLHILHAREFLRYWPVVLLAIGLVQISQARTTAGAIGGGFWILVGSVLLGNRLGIIDANLWAFWPLLLVLVGGRIVWQTMSAGRDTRAIDTSSKVSLVAVMGGFESRVASQTFRGGEITAFMGGGKLDLREAVLADGQAVINVFAMMGGFEIVVPESWRVVSEVTPLMGGIEDKTSSADHASGPLLILRGFLMMGGVTLSNR